MTRRLTKSELEYYANAKPSTKKEVGFFDEHGKLTLGPFYSAKLGKKFVCWDHGSYIREHGTYVRHDHALQGAKLFQAKCRELLANGEYDKDDDA